MHLHRSQSNPKCPWQRRALLRLASVAALSVGASVAHAQFRASIQGTVSDPTGAVVPNATITLVDDETNRTLNATSNDSGVYNFNGLPPDHFTLTASAAGFRKQVLSHLTITPDQINGVNVELALGDTNTSVTVTGDQAPPLDTASATIGGSVDSNAIQHLPSSGRDIFQLVQLAPGVFGDGSQSASGTGANNTPGSQGPGGATRATGIFSTENGPQANANGGQYETNSIQIDGISTVSSVWGGTSVITPSEDSVGNLKVVSNAYDAENGRFSGAQIQLTSKTGTNEYHGSFFFRANRPGLNAYQRYNGANTFHTGSPSDRGLLRDTTRSNQYGGSVGGPILHNRLFAFFAYETQRDRSSQTNTAWYETDAFRALAPANSIASQFLTFPGAAVSASAITTQTCKDAGFNEDPTVGAVNCRTIPGQGLNLGSPLKQALGTQDLSWQSTTNPGVGGGLSNVADIANYTTSNPTTQTGAQYNGRLDSDVTKNDHVAFAIYWVPFSKTNYSGSTRSYNLFHHNQTNDAYSVIWNHIFSSSFLNEARANDAGYRWNEITSNPQEPFGLPSLNVDTIGNISLGQFGAPGPSNLDQHTYTYKDVATKITGNHSIKFGGEVTRLYYLNNPTYSARPSYSFYNIWDLLNDAPHREDGSFNPLTGTPTTNRQDTRSTLYGFFVQDDWKARSNLTLNVGLRYSYFGPLSSKQNNLNRVILGSGPTTFTNLSLRRGGNLTDAQKGNFGPQFGFALSPDMFHGKAVVRGGYGLSFNQSEISISGNAGSNPPNVLGASFISGNPTAIDPNIVYGVAQDPRSLFGYPPNPHTITTFNSANLPLTGRPSVVAYQSTQPTIYTQHFSLDTQIDLGHQLVASVGYQGSLTRHLIINSKLYVNGFAQGFAQNPLINDVQYYGNNGTANNNSLLLGLKQQFAHHVMFDAEFNYAKTMDTGSDPFYQDPYPYDPSRAYGRSDFNYGKAFKLYGVWQPVFFHGNSLLSKVADGWSISSIFNIHTGFPFTASYQVPGGNLYYASSNYSQLRPANYNRNGGNNHSNAAFENGRPNLNFPQAGQTQPYFVLPSAPVSGASGFAAGLPTPGISRNSFDGPGYRDVDATLTKSFGLPNGRVIGEHGAIEIRADAFNLFNLTNLQSSSIVTDIQSPIFGQAQNGLAGRIVNLQARFSF